MLSSPYSALALYDHACAFWCTMQVWIPIIFIYLLIYLCILLYYLIWQVRRKDFWLLSTVTKLLKGFIPNLSHDADGLIFQVLKRLEPVSNFWCPFLYTMITWLLFHQAKILWLGLRLIFILINDAHLLVLLEHWKHWKFLMWRMTEWVSCRWWIFENCAACPRS